MFINTVCVCELIGGGTGNTKGTLKTCGNWGLNPQTSCCETIANDASVLHCYVYCFKSECYDFINFRSER